MANFGPKQWTNHFGRMSIICCSFYNLENCFFLLEYHKAYFPGHYRLKKYVGNKANFGPKRQSNPFEKISIV